MCTVDYDAASVYSHRVVKAARKRHRCTECGRTIEAGETYGYTFGVWDDPSTFKTCSGCLLGLEWLRVNCGGFMHGDIAEELREHFDGEESGIWDGSYLPDNAPRAEGPPKIGSYGWREYPKALSWQPTRSRLWLGRVVVGMRNQWRVGNVEALAAR